MSRALATLFAVLAGAAPAGAACPTETTFDPSVPTWSEVNGFELGSRQASYAEVVRYMDELERSSPSVSGGDLGLESWRGWPIPYAIVASSENLEEPRLSKIGERLRALRAAKEEPDRVQEVARRQPAIVAIGAGVHGNEPSGIDASLRLMYELAARTDCANLERLDRLVTVFLPVQNPDGLIAGGPGNAYRFDLNRDWFARTQPETRAKLALLRRYPPAVFVDAHEEAGESFSLPPAADPVHHEIPVQALGAIGDVFAPALAAAAGDAGFDFTTGGAYDLFFMGAGDAAAATAFGAAAMSFAKGAGSPYSERTAEQFAVLDAALGAAAANKVGLLTGWGEQWVAAVRQGRRGALQGVPDERVFGYFIRADRSGADAARLARRLRSFDVEVYRLSEPAVLRGARLYGRHGFRSRRLPAGTFWIPLAQSQKHWIQALLGEDPRAEDGSFQDVAAWSGPLLMGLQGGYVSRRLRAKFELWDGASLGQVKGPGPAWEFPGDSSEELGLMMDVLRAGGRVIRSRTGTIALRIGKRKLTRMARERDAVLSSFDASPPPRHSAYLRLPKVAILGDAVLSDSSAGFAKYVAERRFGIGADVVSVEDVNAGALRQGGYDTFVVPTEPFGVPDAGLVRDFVDAGGRYVGLGRGGLLVAAAAGITRTTTLEEPPGFDVRGVPLRMEVDRIEPIGWGFFEFEGWLFNRGDPILRADAATGTVVARHPDARGFFAAGHNEGAGALRGTDVAISEEIGDGQSILLSFDPNFRGYTEGTIRMFGNALLHPVAGQSAE